MSSATESKGVTRQQVASLLTNVKMTGRKLTSRMVVYGVEGVGKTSFPEGASNPHFLRSRVSFLNSLKVALLYHRSRVLPHQEARQFKYTQ